MPAINFTGLASGLDTRALIDAILGAEREPIERLQERQALFSQRRAAFDELRSKLDSFENALRDLGSNRIFRGRTTTVSDESILRAGAGPNAETGLFTIDVGQLAAAHKVKSVGLSASDLGLVTDGTISIQSGSNDPITIDVSAASGNNTLQAIRDEINAADAGVQASIIFDGANYLLTVRAEESGTANGLTISDATNLDLDEAANEVTAAEDARIVVDGITVTSSSNKLTQTIPGVTLDLLSLGSVTVEIAQDVDGVVEATEGLIDQYNELIDFFNQHNGPEAAGALSGDATLRNIQFRIQNLFTRGVEGIPLGQLRSLSSLGVDFEGKTGKANLDAGKLRDLLESNFKEVGDLFLSSGRTTHPRIQFAGATSATVVGEYAVEITQAAEQATVVGGAAISQLNGDEELTITVGPDEVTVNLLKDMQIAEIVDTINADLSAAGIAATASDDGGKLRISTDEYGSEASITVVSNRNFIPSGKRSGFDDSPATDSGEDVAGKIGGVDALGDGKFLTGADGEDFGGLAVRVNATAADVAASGGDFGTVSYSRGLIDTLLLDIEQLTRFDSGALDLARESLDKNIARFDDDIARIEDRLVIREARLIKTFAAAERAISILQAQQASLSGGIRT